MVPIEKYGELSAKAMASDQFIINGENGSRIKYALIDDIMCITDVFVPEEFRGRGIARQMMESLSHSKMFLEAVSDNLSAKTIIKFYESVGFYHIGKRYMYKEGVKV